jgi:type IV pilus assembly protein PilV
MNTRPCSPDKQGGVMLLEALIAILIFSLGILAIVGLQAAAIRNSGDAKFRADASLLANELIAQMWVSDRTPAALQTKFQGGQGTNGSAYTAWLPDVYTALPGVSGVAVNQPTVAVSSVPNSSSSLVTITLFWTTQSQPALTHTLAHKYVAVAQIF